MHFLLILLGALLSESKYSAIVFPSTQPDIYLNDLLLNFAEIRKPFKFGTT